MSENLKLRPRQDQELNITELTEYFVYNLVRLSTMFMKPSAVETALDRIAAASQKAAIWWRSAIRCLLILKRPGPNPGESWLGAPSQLLPTFDLGYERIDLTCGSVGIHDLHGCPQPEAKAMRSGLSPCPDGDDWRRTVSGPGAASAN